MKQFKHNTVVSVGYMKERRIGVSKLGTKSLLGHLLWQPGDIGLSGKSTAAASLGSLSSPDSCLQQISMFSYSSYTLLEMTIWANIPENWNEYVLT